MAGWLGPQGQAAFLKQAGEAEGATPSGGQAGRQAGAAPSASASFGMAACVCVLEHTTWGSARRCAAKTFEGRRETVLLPTGTDGRTLARSGAAASEEGGRWGGRD